jgi:molecular chaperone DnaK
MPQIEVTFDVDANGILNVKALDKSSGKTQSVRIEASSGLTDADIKKMQADAELHAEEDKLKKDIADVKNTSEMLLYSAEKAVKENEAKITSEIKDGVNAKISALRAVKDGTDMEAIKKATSDLSAEMSKIGEHMSKNQQTPPAPPTGDQNPGDDPVRDAETK